MTKALANFLIGPLARAQPSSSPCCHNKHFVLNSSFLNIRNFKVHYSDLHIINGLWLLALYQEALSNWRKVVIAATSASTFNQNKKGLLSYVQPSIEAEFLLTELAVVIMYDKHGFLQPILYEDRQEEIRKASRKRIGELKYENIAKFLETWMPVLATAELSVRDLPKLAELQRLCYELGDLLGAKLDASKASGVCKVGFRDENEALLISLHRLVLDLRNSISVRRESLENLIFTSLFMF